MISKTTNSEDVQEWFLKYAPNDNGVGRFAELAKFFEKKRWTYCTSPYTGSTIKLFRKKRSR